ncbi:protein FAM167A-like [Haliotis rufescens]|uniref:protein FAM167A-like n=1 Tax=Haliotis rufescens TaxID=6454 RepID=UPI001EB0ACA7|nr:protein FAM167A-like [Haliotis rufescens]
MMVGRKDEGSHTPKDKRRHLPVIREDSDGDEHSVNTPETIEDHRRSVDPSSALSKLKETTARLKLTTRRASILAWQAEHIEKPRFPPKEVLLNENDGKLTDDRKKRINDALEWLRNELEEMRTQDQTLARQFLTIKQDIAQVKLRRSCEEHQEMLEDVQSELEELNEMSDVLDLPVSSLSDTPLKQLGITRMNMSRRRFSMC